MILFLGLITPLVESESIDIVFQITNPLDETPYQMESLIDWLKNSIQEPEIHHLVAVELSKSPKLYSNKSATIPDKYLGSINLGPN